MHYMKCSDDERNEKRDESHQAEYGPALVVGALGMAEPCRPHGAT
jgi:hypothetical protein